MTITLQIENFGNVELSNLSLVDDLDATFGAGNYTVGATSITTPPATSTITLNPGYTGAAGATAELLNAAASALAVGEFARIAIPVTVTNITDQGNGVGMYLNTAIGAGDPPSGPGGRVMDTSTDGDDPDPGGDGNPTNENDPTPIAVMPPTPLIGVAKQATVMGNSVTITVRIENLGGVALSNLSLIDDLDATFGAGNYTVGATSITTPPATSTITLNPSYTGAAGATAELLNAAASGLAVGEFARIAIPVTVTNITDQGNGVGMYLNTAIGAGDPPSGPGDRVMDTSTDGDDPDPNDDNNPDEDPPTPISLLTPPPAPLIGVAKQATVTGIEVTLTLRIENFGGVALSNLSLVDDLDATFGAGNYTVGATSLATPPATSVITLNPGYTGAAGATAELLNIAASGLAVGEFARIVIPVTITNITDQGNGVGNYLNTAIGAGDPPSGPGGRVTDISTDGVDPDPGGDGNPTNENNPTPIVVTPSDPRIGMAKQATVAGNEAG